MVTVQDVRGAFAVSVVFGAACTLLPSDAVPLRIVAALPLLFVLPGFGFADALLRPACADTATGFVDDRPELGSGRLSPARLGPREPPLSQAEMSGDTHADYLRAQRGDTSWCAARVLHADADSAEVFAHTQPRQRRSRRRRKTARCASGGGSAA